MSKIGPHQTSVDVTVGACPACKEPLVARVAASVSVTATGQKPTEKDPSVVRLNYDEVKVEHARVSHDCGPKVADPSLCGGAA